uniref:Uncharacterized protein n=1 Tax=Rhipicephalus zambeziensis TaxID=60191 RepID=A0A224YK92_9ACAR
MNCKGNIASRSSTSKNWCTMQSSSKQVPYRTPYQIQNLGPVSVYSQASKTKAGRTRPKMLAAVRKVNVALSPVYNRLNCAVIMRHVSVASMSQKVFQLWKSLLFQ